MVTVQIVYVWVVCCFSHEFSRGVYYNINKWMKYGIEPVPNL